MQIRNLATILLATSLLGSCGENDIPNLPQANEKLVGIWKQDSGNLFTLPFGDTRWQLQYIALNEDGTGEVYSVNTSSGARGCSRMSYSALSDTSFVWEAAAYADQAVTYRYTVSGTTMTLEGSNGHSSSFSSLDALPEEATCAVFADAEKIAGLEPPAEQRQNIVFDGTYLWYASQGNGNGYSRHHKVDPSTGEMLATVDPPAGFVGKELRAVQGTDFWVTSMSGGSEVWRLAAATGGTVYSFDAGTFAGDDQLAYVRALTPDGNVLWVFGGNTAGDMRLLKVDVSAAAAVVSSTPFEVNIWDLTVASSFLWAIGNDAFDGVYRVDPATMAIAATYELPDPNVNFEGITSDGANLYLRADDRTVTPTQAAIYRVTP